MLLAENLAAFDRRIMGQLRGWGNSHQIPAHKRERCGMAEPSTRHKH